MKLLFDQNLSRHLVRELHPEFADSAHVSSLDLDTATDHEIWAYAAENDYLIVSKDSDFRQLAFLAGPPPKALWLRVGNSPTAAIANCYAPTRPPSPDSPTPTTKPSSYSPESTPNHQRPPKTVRYADEPAEQSRTTNSPQLAVPLLELNSEQQPNPAAAAHPHRLEVTPPRAA